MSVQITSVEILHALFFQCFTVRCKIELGKFMTTRRARALELCDWQMAGEYVCTRTVMHGRYGAMYPAIIITYCYYNARLIKTFALKRRCS